MARRHPTVRPAHRLTTFGQAPATAAGTRDAKTPRGPHAATGHVCTVSPVHLLSFAGQRRDSGYRR